MAALTLPEALKRTRNVAMGAVLKSIVTTDELANVIPVLGVDGTSVPVPREGTLPATEFIGDDGAATEESTGTDDIVHIPVRRIVGNMDVDALADDLTGPTPGSQRGVQIVKKAKATWRKVTDKLVNGAQVTGHALGQSTNPFNAIDAIDYGPWLDSSRRGPGSIKYTHATTSWQFRAPGDVDYGPAVSTGAVDGNYTLKSWNESYFIVVTLDVSDAAQDGETHIRFTSTSKEFDGMKEMCHPSMLIDPTGADGDDYSFKILDRMISNEKVRVNRAFIMNAKLVEAHYAALRALGGADPQMMELAAYSMPGSPTGFGKVPTYRGIPLLTDDFIESTETVGATTTCASIYLASLDADEGLFLGAAGGSSFNAEGDPRSRVVMGWRIVDLGERDEKDHRRTRVKFYGTPGLKSKLALVRRRGIKTA